MFPVKDVTHVPGCTGLELEREREREPGLERERDPEPEPPQSGGPHERLLSLRRPDLASNW